MMTMTTRKANAARIAMDMAVELVDACEPFHHVPPVLHTDEAKPWKVRVEWGGRVATVDWSGFYAIDGVGFLADDVVNAARRLVLAK